MTDRLKNLVDFVAFTHDIQSVKRAMLVNGDERYENDSEHSFQMAMIALYVIQENHLPLDIFRTMAMAVVHDVLEIHSGDTPVFANVEVLSTKSEREEAAIRKLKRQWPKLGLMHELIKEYESKSSPESKFLYALDKLVPMLNNYLDDGRSWKRHEVSLDDVISVKIGKIDIDPTVNGYYKLVLELIKQHPELFSRA